MKTYAHATLFLFILKNLFADANKRKRIKKFYALKALDQNLHDG